MTSRTLTKKIHVQKAVKLVAEQRFNVQSHSTQLFLVIWTFFLCFIAQTVISERVWYDVCIPTDMTVSVHIIVKKMLDL